MVLVKKLKDAPEPKVLKTCNHIFDFSKHVDQYSYDKHFFTRFHKTKFYFVSVTIKITKNYPPPYSKHWEIYYKNSLNDHV